MDKKKQRSSKGKAKKKLILTQKEANRLKIIITLAVLLVAALTYYIIDSSSYVATVDNQRISKAEFNFFLKQQQLVIEQEEGLSSKTSDEIKEFWTKTTDGQNPWEEAKRDALDASKEYMVQLIKAKEAGFTVNTQIKNEAANILATYKSSMTDNQFESYVQYSFNVSARDLSRITENLLVIDDFRESYLKKNYQPAEISDEELKAYYEKDIKVFDKVDISYISFAKLGENGILSDEELEKKRKDAEALLERVKQGEDMDKLIAEYTEDTVPEDSDTPLGKATLTYSEGTLVQNLIDWAFNNKPGDSDIVETDFVIYVVKIDKRTSFEDVKANVKATMEDEAMDKFYEEALQSWSLEPKYNIVKNERVYESFTYK